MKKTKLIKPKEAAALLGIGIPTIYTMMRTGLLDARGFGEKHQRNRYVTLQSVLSFCDGGTKK